MIVESPATPTGLPIRRIEALTDGVFAIAMTLLVFGIELPHTDGTLWTRLGTLWPRFASYALSFVMLGVLWVGHHYQLHHVKRTNRPLIWINLAFLLTITFLPFGTGVMGAERLAAPAVVLYGAALVVSAAALYAHWAYVTRRPELLVARVDPNVVAALKGRILFGIGVSCLASAFAFVDSRVSLVIFLAMPIAYFRHSKVDHVVGDND